MILKSTGTFFRKTSGGRRVPGKLNSRSQFEEPLRGQGSVPFILVLEEHEYIPPALFPHQLQPVLQLLIAVIEPPQPQITPIPGRNKWYPKIVVRLGDAQRGLMIAQQPEDLFLEPRLMAKFKRNSTLRRQQSKKVAQPRHILLQVRRQLKKQRPQALLQRPGGLTDREKDLLRPYILDSIVKD